MEFSKLVKLLLIGLGSIGLFFYLSGGNAPRLEDIEKATGKVKGSDRIMLVTISSKGCIICKKVKEGIDSKEIDLPRSKFVWLDIDYEDKEKLSWARYRYDLKSLSFPTFVAENGRGDVISTQYGASSADDVNHFLARVLKRNEDSIKARKQLEEKQQLETPANTPKWAYDRRYIFEDTKHDLDLLYAAMKPLDDEGMLKREDMDAGAELLQLNKLNSRLIIEEENGQIVGIKVTSYSTLLEGLSEVSLELAASPKEGEYEIIDYHLRSALGKQTDGVNALKEGCAQFEQKNCTTLKIRQLPDGGYHLISVLITGLPESLHFSKVREYPKYLSEMPSDLKVSKPKKVSQQYAEELPIAATPDSNLSPHSFLEEIRVTGVSKRGAIINGEFVKFGRPLHENKAIKLLGYKRDTLIFADESGNQFQKQVSFR